MRISLIFALGGAAILAAQDHSATLSGEIRDGAGAGIPSTSVELKLREAPNTLFSVRTDDGGKFKFILLPVGTYMLKLTRIGFRTLGLTSIQIASGEQKIMPPLRVEVAGSCGFGGPAGENLQFRPAEQGAGNLTGRVERDEAHPIARATVKLLCDERKVCGETKTDSNGEFIFFNLAPRDDITIHVSDAGFYDWEVSGYDQAGFDSTYEPITMDSKLRSKRPLIVCE